MVNTMKKGTTRTSDRKRLTKEQILEMIADGTLKNATWAPPDDPAYETGPVIGWRPLFSPAEVSKLKEEQELLDSIHAEQSEAIPHQWGSSNSRTGRGKKT